MQGRSLVCLTAVVLGAAPPGLAQPALTFSQARSILDPPQCRQDAVEAFERHGYGGIEARRDYVLATKPTVRAMISCLPAGDRTLRTIVVTGESGEEARVEHDALRDRLSVFDTSTPAARETGVRSPDRRVPAPDRTAVEATARAALPPPVAIAWSTSAAEAGGPGGPGRVERYACPPRGRPSPVWGTTIYAAGSSICTAAVHVGVIGLADGGDVTIARQPGEPAYRGSLRHGIRSLDAGPAEASFVVLVVR